jgi:hypothetical protein
MGGAKWPKAKTNPLPAAILNQKSTGDGPFVTS